MIDPMTLIQVLYIFAKITEVGAISYVVMKPYLAYKGNAISLAEFIKSILGSFFAIILVNLIPDVSMVYHGMIIPSLTIICELTIIIASYLTVAALINRGIISMKDLEKVTVKEYEYIEPEGAIFTLIVPEKYERTVEKLYTRKARKIEVKLKGRSKYVYEDILKKFLIANVNLSLLFEYIVTLLITH